MNYSRIADWISSLWWKALYFFRLKKPFEIVFDEESQAEFEADILRYGEMIKREEQAYEEARTGEGPQPWDEDWYQFEVYHQELCDQIYTLALKAGWHRVQRFKQILEIAWSTPQMQQAYEALRANYYQEPGDPLRETLKLLQEVYVPIQNASLEMLRRQSQGLRYTEKWEEYLENALEKLAPCTENAAK